MRPYAKHLPVIIIWRQMIRHICTYLLAVVDHKLEENNDVLRKTIHLQGAICCTSVFFEASIEV